MAAGDDSRLSRQVKCRYQSPSEDTAAPIAELACCDSRSQPSSHCRQLSTANLCDYRMQRCEQKYMTKSQLAIARHVLPTQGAVWVNMDAKARPKFGELDRSSIRTNCRSSEKGGSHKCSPSHLLSASENRPREFQHYYGDLHLRQSSPKMLRRSSKGPKSARNPQIAGLQRSAEGVRVR